MTLALDVGVDTDDNSVDFTTDAPTPTNSAGETTAPLTFLDPGPQAFIVDEAIEPIVLAAGGGTDPYTFDVDEADLPDGLTFDDVDTIAGTPVETGSFVVDVTVTDSATPTAATNGTLTITDLWRVFNIATSVVTRAQGKTKFSGQVDMQGYPLKGEMTAGFELKAAPIAQATATAPATVTQ